MENNHEIKPSQEKCYPQINSLLLASGEIHGEFLRKFRRSYAKTRIDRSKMMTKQIEEFRNMGLVNVDEERKLNYMISLVINCDSSDGQDGKKFYIRQINEIFKEFIDNKCSPLAISIASIAVNSTNTSIDFISKQSNTTAMGPAESDVSGALAGGGVGATVGSAAAPGPGTLAGSILGAIFGAQAGTIAWAVDNVLD